MHILEERYYMRFPEQNFENAHIQCLTLGSFQVKKKTTFLFFIYFLISLTIEWKWGPKEILSILIFVKGIVPPKIELSQIFTHSLHVEIYLLFMIVK